MNDARHTDRDMRAEINHYDYSGIDEHPGVVPKWLLFVCAALLIWSVYYLLQYWREPGIGGLGG